MTRSWLQAQSLMHTEPLSVKNEDSQQPVFHVLFRDVAPRTAPAVEEVEVWRFVSQHLHTNSLPLVLFRPSDLVWQSGSENIKAEIRGLVTDYAPHFGYPCTVTSDSRSHKRHAVWVLCMPDENFSILQIQMFEDEDAPDEVILTPVFSIDPTVRPGSLEALDLLFSHVVQPCYEILQSRPSPRSY